jgi:hypothetical protein
MERYYSDPIYQQHCKQCRKKLYQKQPDVVERRRLHEQRKATREIAKAAAKAATQRRVADHQAERQALIASFGGLAEYQRLSRQKKRLREKARCTDAQRETMQVRWRKRNSNPDRRRKEGERKTKYVVLVRALREVGLLG